MSIVKYAGRHLPTRKHYPDGRLPVSERTAELPGHKALQHSTHYDVTPRHIVEQSLRASKERTNNMFNLTQAIPTDSVPSGTRAGKPRKDWSKDVAYQALKGMPVNEDAWYASEESFTDKSLAAKFQSKIAMYAKAGAGTFKTRARGDKVYICKVNAEYVQQRNASDD